MKRYVVGDIHGRVKALKEVLEKSNFDYDNDTLISLGDVTDGGINTYKVVEELLKIKNLIYVFGNHDEWFMNHIKSGWAEEIWLQQGGAETLKSYGASVIKAKRHWETSRLDTTNINIPITHQHFFNKGKYYYIKDNMLFVHGGFRPEVGVKKETRFNLIWDRDLIKYAQAGNTVKPYDWVFVGHTTTQTYGLTQPIRYKNLYMMDCGAGWNGKLAIMDIDTKKYKLSRQQVSSARVKVGHKAREMTKRLHTEFDKD